MNTVGIGDRRFVTSGIWRPAHLEAWDKPRIADSAIRQRDVSREVAHLNAEVEVEASCRRAGHGHRQVRQQRRSRPRSRAPSASTPAATSSIYPPKSANPNSGIPPATATSRSTSSPRRPAQAAGRPNTRKDKTGLRSIVLDRHLDKWGRSFQLVVNGIPVFAKGADVIPFDSFPNRVTTADYRRILESARDANMNMIRHGAAATTKTMSSTRSATN